LIDEAKLELKTNRNFNLEELLKDDKYGEKLSKDEIEKLKIFINNNK
jgi:hypothetical protein